MSTALSPSRADVYQCPHCCAGPIEWFETETKTVVVSKQGAVFDCPGDADDGKVYTDLTIANLGVGSPPACGGLIRYAVASGSGTLPANTRWDTVCVVVPEGDFPDLPGTPTSTTGSVSYGTGDVISYTYSEEVTNDTLYAEAASFLSVASWVANQSVPVDLLEWLSTYENQALTFSKSRFKFRHTPSYMDSDGNVRGTCWHGLFEITNVGVSETVLSDFTYDWDGTLPGGFDHTDEGTYPGSYASWVDMPTLTLAQIGTINTVYVTATTRCNP